MYRGLWCVCMYFVRASRCIFTCISILKDLQKLRLFLVLFILVVALIFSPANIFEPGACHSFLTHKILTYVVFFSFRSSFLFYYTPGKDNQLLADFQFDWSLQRGCCRFFLVFFPLSNAIDTGHRRWCTLKDCMGNGMELWLKKKVFYYVIRHFIRLCIFVLLFQRYFLLLFDFAPIKRTRCLYQFAHPSQVRTHPPINSNIINLHYTLFLTCMTSSF